MISRNPSCNMLLFLFLSFMLVPFGAEETRKLYIAYMGEKQHDDPTIVTALHHETLASVLGSKEAAMGSMVYSYKHGFSGFAAMLTESQARSIAESPGVLRVAPSRKYQAHTTRSWDFLHLDLDHWKELLQKSNWGDDSIVGIIDTGIWPEAESFNDRGYGPVPWRWKGQCVAGERFSKSNCNRKIIGARWYHGGVEKKYVRQDYLSARCLDCHGAHTASIAAGSFVHNASFHGLAKGDARGGAPRARIAMYKVLWGENGHGTDAAVMAAVDDAIHDGVDVLSLSLGPGNTFEGDSSFVTLGATMKGITVVYSAGNTGSKAQSVANLAPWVITVAATNVDRSFPTTITLGNNKTLVGQGMYYGSSKETKFEDIVYGERCTKLNKTEVVGKVVLCRSGSAPPRSHLLVAALRVGAAGGKGLIFAHYTTNDLEEIVQVCKLVDCGGNLPLVHVDLEIGTLISIYISSVRSPVVKIGLTTTVTGSEINSPIVASFSSRGPNVLIPEVLKPDIAAPGVGILASVGRSFGFKSGTSMAAPHIAGIVALLKSLHPEWSPAEIKSALVTTASVTDRYGRPMKAEGVPRKLADPFDYGGGLVNPNRAADPGLVYDIDPKDYKNLFHCSYGSDVICSSTKNRAYNLNLPSITIPDLKRSMTVVRTVKNIGDVNAVYKVTFEPPDGIQMDVQPKILVFKTGTTIQSFDVTLSPKFKVQGDYTFGSLTWSDGKHVVRIPISVKIVVHDFYADVS